MRATDLIYKKREGGAHTCGELSFLIDGFLAGEIPDYQLSAWLMAIYFRGLDQRETVDLTRIMIDSGERVDLSSIGGFICDKHSTGGVGDKTTLVLAPLVAACGLPVAKMSGRGLGHTGGTLDKLESIPGFRTDLSEEEFKTQVQREGLAIAGQTRKLVPADRKLYALRDVTATVESLPLIASSIMSKKLAGGAEGIMLDVKCGSGAFLQEETKAVHLAEMMITLGEDLGRKVEALITAMDQPLGYAVGNAIEVREAISTLKGEGPADLVELCLELTARILLMAGKVADLEAGIKRAESALLGGQALNRFQRMVSAQGGDPDVLDRPNLLFSEDMQAEVRAEESGVIQRVEARSIGRAAVLLGAGRAKKGDEISHQAGILLLKKCGNYVKKGDPVARFYGRSKELEEARRLVENAFEYGTEKVESPLIIAAIGSLGIDQE